jgi:integrase
VLPFVSSPVAALVQLQRLTGMRPYEVVQMRACDIDMRGDVWIYEPQNHKNQWRGHRRLVALGPKAQTIIKRFLKLDLSAYLFSPQEAEAERNQQRRLNRDNDFDQPKRGPVFTEQTALDHSKVIADLAGPRLPSSVLTDLVGFKDARLFHRPEAITPQLKGVRRSLSPFRYTL